MCVGVVQDGLTDFLPRYDRWSTEHRQEEARQEGEGQGQEPFEAGGGSEGDPWIRLDSSLDRSLPSDRICSAFALFAEPDRPGRDCRSFLHISWMTVIRWYLESIMRGSLSFITTFLLLFSFGWLQGHYTRWDTPARVVGAGYLRYTGKGTIDKWTVGKWEDFFDGGSQQ